MLGTILRSLSAGVVTTRYPEGPVEPAGGFRGAPEIGRGRRFADLPPPDACPAGAIAWRSEGSQRGYAIDLARCIFCGRCESRQPDGPVTLGRHFELSARRRADLVLEVTCDGEGAIAEPPVSPATHDEVDARVRDVLGRSLHLRHLDAGSCNACDWELTALLNPVYDVRRLGIDFVASPRHADGVIVTGSVTRNLELAVRRTCAAIPEPRIVIAVGACAASGGIVGRSYASAGGVSEVLPVDVLVPGCPPRPEAIIFGILLALGRLDARRSVIKA